MLLAVLGLAFTLVHWWRDVILRGPHRASHRGGVQGPAHRHGAVHHLRGAVLQLFWAYFWGRVSSGTVEGYTWLPAAHPVDAWDIPFLNTLILLLSAAPVTWAHHCVREGDNRTATKAGAHCGTRHPVHEPSGLHEYIHTIYSPQGFQISSGIFGSTFYMATGFHGFHVMIGTTFLIVHFPRLLQPIPTRQARRARGRRVVLALRRRGLAVPVHLGILAVGIVLAGAGHWIDAPPQLFGSGAEEPLPRLRRGATVRGPCGARLLSGLRHRSVRPGQRRRAGGVHRADRGRDRGHPRPPRRSLARCGCTCCSGGRSPWRWCPR